MLVRLAYFLPGNGLKRVTIRPFAMPGGLSSWDGSVESLSGMTNALWLFLKVFRERVLIDPGVHILKQLCKLFMREPRFRHSLF